MATPLPHTRKRRIVPRTTSHADHARHLVRMHCPHCAAPLKAPPEAFLHERTCAACGQIGAFIHEPPRHRRHTLTMPSNATAHSPDRRKAGDAASVKAPALPDRPAPEQTGFRIGTTAPGIDEAANPPSSSLHATHPAPADSMAPHATATKASGMPLQPESSPSSSAHASSGHAATGQFRPSRRPGMLRAALLAGGVIGFWLAGAVLFHTLGSRAAHEEHARTRAAEAVVQEREAARLHQENQRLTEALAKAEAESDPALRAATLAALRDQARASASPVQPQIEDAYLAALLARQDAIHDARLADAQSGIRVMREQLTRMQSELEAFAAAQTNQTASATRMQARLERREREIEALRHQVAQQKESANTSAQTIATLKQEADAIRETLRQQEHSQERLQARMEAERAAQIRSTRTSPPIVVVNRAPTPPRPTIVNYSFTEYRNRQPVFIPMPIHIHRRRHPRPPHPFIPSRPHPRPRPPYSIRFRWSP